MSETPQTPPLIHANEDKKYEIALQLKYYEGQISWQMNVLFVGLNIGIGTIIQNKLEKFTSFDAPTIIMSIIGLVINIFWLGTFLRNNKYYNFRMAQARHSEPSNFSLVNGRGYRFSKGKLVIIPATPDDEESSHKLTQFEQICSNKNAIKVAIFCFLSGFLLLLVLSFVPCLR